MIIKFHVLLMNFLYLNQTLLEIFVTSKEI